MEIILSNSVRTKVLFSYSVRTNIFSNGVRTKVLFSYSVRTEAVQVSKFYFLTVHCRHRSCIFLQSRNLSFIFLQCKNRNFISLQYWDQSFIFVQYVDQRFIKYFALLALLSSSTGCNCVWRGQKSTCCGHVLKGVFYTFLWPLVQCAASRLFTVQ